MKKVKQVNVPSILIGMGLGILVGIAITLVSTSFNISISFQDLALLASMPIIFGGFVGYSVS